MEIPADANLIDTPVADQTSLFTVSAAEELDPSWLFAQPDGADSADPENAARGLPTVIGNICAQ